MGMFSFVNCDDGSNIWGGDATYLLSPDGNHIYEPSYELYGEFGGVDCFVHWMMWNQPEVCRELKDDPEAIRDAFFGTVWENGNMHYHKAKSYYDHAFNQSPEYPYPLKFASEPVDYDSVPPTMGCEFQGWYPFEDPPDAEEDPEGYMDYDPVAEEEALYAKNREALYEGWSPKV